MTSTRENGRWVHRFRQSWLSTLQMCPEQARAAYYDELPERPHTDSTALGTAVHAAIETALEDDLDADDAAFVAHIELDGLGDFEAGCGRFDGTPAWVETKYTVAKVYELADQAVRAWDRDIRPHVDSAQTEHTFDVPLYRDAEREIRLTGTIDCVDQNYEVWDWKTAARKYDAWEKQRWAVQPTVYAYAVQAEHDQFFAESNYVLADTIFRYGVMVHDGTTQIIPVRRGHGHVQFLREQCLTAALLIESGASRWPLNDSGWWCHSTWCPKFDDCKGLSMPSDWTVTEKWSAPAEVAA